MVQPSGQPSRQSSPWTYIRKRYSVRPFFSTLLLVGTIAIVVVIAKRNRHDGRGFDLRVPSMSADWAMEIEEVLVTKKDARSPLSTIYCLFLTMVDD